MILNLKSENGLRIYNFGAIDLIDSSIMFVIHKSRTVALFGILCIFAVIMILIQYTHLGEKCLLRKDQLSNIDKMYVVGADKKIYPYHRNMPLIFIGGVRSSGTTLMRAMLDAHPEVRCGPETRVIPRLLHLRRRWLKSEIEKLRLSEAGITNEIINSAIAQFCLEIIARHSEPAARLCNNDPIMLKLGSYMIELFPNAKFLFMVRDGRATVDSLISLNKTMHGFNLSNYRQTMYTWNRATVRMNNECFHIGNDKCMVVYYEQLVLHPEQWLRKILSFLDVPWNETVLHHEDFINQPNGIMLSKFEHSADQVTKPVNFEELTKWVGKIPEDVLKDMTTVAPILSVLGYDPYANPPDYIRPYSRDHDSIYKMIGEETLWNYKPKPIRLIYQEPDYTDFSDGDGGIRENFVGNNTYYNKILM